VLRAFRAIASSRRKQTSIAARRGAHVGPATALRARSSSVGARKSGLDARCERGIMALLTPLSPTERHSPMAGINKVILIGNLGRDPEIRYTAQGGTAVANFTLATSESFTTREGKREDRTEWHRIVVWGKTAELCTQYLAKGRQVYIEGRIQTREWEDKDGQKRRTTEVVAQTVQFLGGPKGSGGSGSGREGGFDPGGQEPPPPPGRDDIPF
jgi:single-strand DNA-binding protein